MQTNYEHDPDHPLTTAFPYFPPEEQQWLAGELSQILNGMLAMGPRVAQFEKEFAAYCGQSYGIAFPSCTSSMEAALLAFGVGPGDEVLVPVETFIATGMVVSLVGATPVFTEISPGSFSMDFDDAWSRVSEKTKGAIVVHFGGFISPQLPAFVAKMRASGRFVIEDAAHAPGAELNGKLAGSIGDAGCFSFYPTKIMSTGEGGMLVTARQDIAKTVRSLQLRGRDLDAPGELYVRAGRNNRFTEIAAAMGLSQLRSLPEFLAARRRVAAIYDEMLLRSELFVPLLAEDGSVPSYWRYIATPTVAIERVALRDRLAADKITIDWAYDPPLHLQPVYQQTMGTRRGMLPRSEDMLARHICLPVHARMRDKDAEFVAQRLLAHVTELAQAAQQTS
ncbi:MAG TPA: DegT/DnrJ/EryC1/StrS family aminotransferase [Pyrinomonadaceae bacterium]|nr:DegT/DnrJ/EryC1/StrS family aminotransferase [Pyrinomonadaceae bacterium]